MLVLFFYVTKDVKPAYIAELTDENFFDYAKSKDTLLVDFYAPW